MQRLYEIIEVGNEDDKLSKLYDYFLLIVIVLSIIPLMLKEAPTAFIVIEGFCVTIFIIDYILRFITANKKYKMGIKSYIKYPFTFYAIVDFISILPSINLIPSTFKLLKTIRLTRCLRVFKTIRFSKNVIILCNVFEKQKKNLLSILSLAAAYILFTALLMFNVEQDSFETFFDAMYWAVTALTTVGYGDIYPITDIGRVVSMISSVFGIAVIALPSGVITAGFLEEIKSKEVTKQNEV